MAPRVIPLRINPGMAGDPAKGAPYRTDWSASFRNRAVRFEVDVARPMSYPGGSYLTRAAAADPVNNQTITNLAESYPGISLGDGIIQAAGAQIDFQNGGLDFSDTTTQDQGIAAPASVSADINTAYGGAVVTASIATTTMTVTNVASGSVKPGQEIAGVTAGTQVRRQLTSTETGGTLGGRGTYEVSHSQTVASGTLNLSGARQRIGVAILMRLPSTANWPGSGVTISYFGDKTDNGAPAAFGNFNFFGHPSLANGFNVRRQYAASSGATQPQIFLSEVNCWAMVSYAYKPQGDAVLQVRTPNALVSGTVAAGTGASVGLNSQDWSANNLVIGRPAIFGGNGSLAAFTDMRIGWASIVNLGRDPDTDFLAQCDLEYGRRIATGLYT